MQDPTINKIFNGEAKFIIGATKFSAIPQTSLPEFAFIGRSNVGKSSLINALLNRKKLVRTSKNPGCTRQINFFEIAEKFNLVDLPGYGYARISKADRNKWEKLIYDYLANSPNLVYSFILVDSRHLFKDSDLEIMRILDDIGNPYQIIFTKADKKNQLKELDFASAVSDFTSCFKQPIISSADSKTGIADIREKIFSYL